MTPEAIIYLRTRTLNGSYPTVINNCEVHVPRVERRIDPAGSLRRLAKLRVHTIGNAPCISWVAAGETVTIGDQCWQVASITSAPGAVGAAVVVLGLPNETAMEPGDQGV